MTADARPLGAIAAEAIDLHGLIIAATTVTIATYGTGKTAQALAGLGLGTTDPTHRAIVSAAGIQARLSLLNAGLAGRVRGETVTAERAWRVFAEHETGSFTPSVLRAAGEEITP